MRRDEEVRGVDGQALNPYLPTWEYVPDDEPRVFGDRVYVYGSHDRFGSRLFCLNDYVCWSASVDDLSAWRHEGVIYGKRQDPRNRLGWRSMYAPDVVRGPDGRYYLFYALDFVGLMSVAVCDEPAGRFEFLGHVRFPDGRLWGESSGDPFPFDPGVLVDDDGSVYLYSGFARKTPRVLSRFRRLTHEGGVVLRLEPDMLTIRSGPSLLFPARGREGAFTDHAFFEASSIRKVDGRYCFVYSSEHNHELCYAMADHPEGPFAFGGTLVDLGDVFLDGRPTERHAVNYLGNTHGGIVSIKDEWHVFYHRQTHRHSYSRQGCAERLVRLDGGGFAQAEVTSCGLNGGPLRGRGRYPASIACHLIGRDGAARYDMPFARWRLRAHPYLTQEHPDSSTTESQHVANVRDGTVVGFKHFACDAVVALELEVRGTFRGRVVASDTVDFSRVGGASSLDVGSKRFTAHRVDCAIPGGTRPLYLRFEGVGALDFAAFTFVTADEDSGNTSNRPVTDL
ncbi:family 43 glycosylhydrolase [Cellulomonas cellasea]|uniref:family 43 glycosylhydrolase n=1 Tax=Cellulomonas cellasea TaxID=43670 RepID=UPI0025A46953|nr:family 43 glycosylhydrolase [Cellulomonas cellasea]MDM8085329.1 family 43 glycosylhydrolase [Cellulomonas cellasea]